MGGYTRWFLSAAAIAFPGDRLAGQEIGEQRSFSSEQLVRIARVVSEQGIRLREMILVQE
jgi:hypothetical protein